MRRIKREGGKMEEGREADNGEDKDIKKGIKRQQGKENRKRRV